MISVQLLGATGGQMGQGAGARAWVWLGIVCGGGGLTVSGWGLGRTGHAGTAALGEGDGEGMDPDAWVLCPGALKALSQEAMTPHFPTLP